MGLLACVWFVCVIGGWVGDGGLRVFRFSDTLYGCCEFACVSLAFCCMVYCFGLLIVLNIDTCGGVSFGFYLVILLLW